MGTRPQLSVRIETRQQAARLALVGELDMATVSILEDRLVHVEGDGVALIVLDLGDLSFIDSTGLHAFLRARDRADSNGHRLSLVGASPLTRRLLTLTGTEFLLEELDAVGAPDELTPSEPSEARQEVEPQASVAV